LQIAWNEYVFGCSNHSPQTLYMIKRIFNRAMYVINVTRVWHFKIDGGE